MHMELMQEPAFTKHLREADKKERKLLNKVIIFVSLSTKSIIVAS